MLSADALVERLARRPAHTALFTDFDGTLSPIVSDPAAARPVPGAVEALTTLATRFRRVAVLSGRPLSYLAPLLPDAIDIGALYGLEQRVAGVAGEHPEARRWRPVIAELVAEATRALAPLAGVTVEPKGLSLTLHFRNGAEHETAVQRFADDAARRTGVHARGAKASVELHPPIDVDKGALLRRWAEGAEVVAFFGDDLGDLPAYAALRALAADGGSGGGDGAGRGGAVEAINVAVTGPETPDAVRRAADVELDGPPAVAALFQRLATAAS